MPQPRPAYQPGQFYHFFNRGRSQLSIFKETDNYLFVLRKIKQYACQFELKLIAYCLMPNHYHFLVRQDGNHSSKLLPQRVFNSYSKAYNRRYQHSGTIFEGDYKVKCILKPDYLLHLCRYIHGNPVKHGLVADPAHWPYSNYLEWVGERRGTLFDAHFARENFPLPANYREFVLADLRGRDLPQEIKRYLDNW